MRKMPTAIEDYFKSLRSLTDPYLQKTREAAASLGLGRISLGDLELEMLTTLVRLHQPRKFIEIGTLTGSSGWAILKGLPEGAEFWTLEKDNRHADLAEPLLQEVARAKNQACQVIRGDARQTLLSLEPEGPFDGIFIDGNKAAYGDYLKWAETNVKKGGLILADNVFLEGSVLGETTERFSVKQIEVMKTFNQRLLDPKLYQSCLIPTSEGLAVALKLF